MALASTAEVVGAKKLMLETLLVASEESPVVDWLIIRSVKNKGKWTFVG
jgi:hypothetical protein